MISSRFVTLGMCLAFAGGALAQTPAAPLEFEVASVKPSQPVTPAMVASGKIHAGMKVDNARVDIGLMPLLQLITKAFDVKQYQVQGPDFLLTTPFDIVAKMPAGATKEQVPQMLQALLRDRFKLTYHRETKEHAVYALVVAKGGFKMEPFKADPEQAAAANGPVTGSNEVTISGGRGQGQTVSDGTGLQQKITPSADGKSIHIEFTKISLPQLSEGLFRFVGRPIVDKTELKGDYNGSMDIALADILAVQRAAGIATPGAGGDGAAKGDARPADAVSDSSGNSVVQSLQAMGLKLEARKLPMETIVIDHIEKTPTEN